MKTLIWISVVVIVASSSCCLVHSQDDDAGAQVTLCIFSGMKDPTWTLSASQTEALRQILASLPPRNIAHSELGYGSFFVELDGTDIRIFNNHVHYGDQWLETKGRALELWLLGTAGAALKPDLAARVWDTLTTPPPAFAIYRVKDHTPSEIAHTDLTLTTLTLPPYPMMTIDDVIEYRADTSELVLTPDALERLASLEVPVSGVPFVITLDDEPVFPGAFWIRLSSQSYYESIVIDITTMSSTGTLKLDLGYPASPDLFSGVDYRNDPRLLNAFEQAGKLRKQ